MSKQREVFELWEDPSCCYSSSISGSMLKTEKKYLETITFDTRFAPLTITLINIGDCKTFAIYYCKRFSHRVFNQTCRDQCWFPIYFEVLFTDIQKALLDTILTFAGSTFFVI